MAFVQGEAIRVYLFNLRSEKITRYLRLETGDSEDLTIIGISAYIFTAGRRPEIYRVENYNGRSTQYTRYDLQLEEEYVPERLCNDTKGNRLLIASKGSPMKRDTERKVLPFNKRRLSHR